MISEAVIGV